MAEQIRYALAIMRLKQVKRETGLSRTTIYEYIKVGTFPAPIQLGPKAVGWRTGDIDCWLSDPVGYRAKPLPVAFVEFDRLSDDDFVNIEVISLLEDCSDKTTWRRVRAKVLPEPEYHGGMAQWRVGTYRAHRAASAASADDRTTRGQQLSMLRAAKAKRATAAENDGAQSSSRDIPSAAPVDPKDRAKTGRKATKAKATETARDPPS